MLYGENLHNLHKLLNIKTDDKKKQWNNILHTQYFTGIRGSYILIVLSTLVQFLTPETIDLDEID